MGYHLPAEIDPASRAGSFATPKTHTPLPRMKERGQRFYSPTLGRWISRDPIAEKGGVLLYAIAVNDCIDGYDILGLGGSKTVTYSRRFSAYLEWFPEQACGEIKVLDRGAEVMRFRYDAAKATVEQILEHSGSLRGISASAMRKIAPDILKSLETVVQRVGGRWILTRLATDKVIETSGRAVIGRFLGSVIVTALMVALEPSTAAAPEPEPLFRFFDISDDVGKILADEGVAPLIEEHPNLEDIKHVGEQSPKCAVDMHVKAEAELNQ